MYIMIWINAEKESEWNEDLNNQNIWREKKNGNLREELSNLQRLVRRKLLHDSHR